MTDHLTGTTEMYVKLRNPNNSSCCLTFEASGEVYAENKGEMTEAERDAWLDAHDDAGYDTRLFRTHGGNNGMAQITIPARPGGNDKMIILTNWNGWLANQFGATIDRLHRHDKLPPNG